MTTLLAARSIALLALVTPLLGGCSRSQTELATGTFLAEVGTRAGDEVPLTWKPSASILLDMTGLQATIQAGADKATFTVVDQGTLDNGDCADEVTGQWATLQGGALTIDGVTFTKPVIFSRCGSVPLQVVLAEEGSGEPSFDAGTPPLLTFTSDQPVGGN
jgi:hypothetical protein